MGLVLTYAHMPTLVSFPCDKSISGELDKERWGNSADNIQL